MYDAIRLKLADIGFSVAVIESIITYLTNHPEEYIRVEDRIKERGEGNENKA